MSWRWCSLCCNCVEVFVAVCVTVISTRYPFCGVSKTQGVAFCTAVCDAAWCSAIRMPCFVLQRVSVCYQHAMLCVSACHAFCQASTRHEKTRYQRTWRNSLRPVAGRARNHRARYRRNGSACICMCAHIYTYIYHIYRQIINIYM